MDIRNGDGLVLVSGSRMIAEGTVWNRGNSLFDDWRIAAWDEMREMRMPIQLIAVVEVWRGGVRVGKNIEQVQQMELF